MFTNLPPRQRRVTKAVLALSWLAAGAAGISATIVSPNTIVAELGRSVVLAWGATVALSAVAAAAGVLFSRYRWEWWSSWFAAAGTLPYVGALWWLVAVGEATRLTQAFFITSLFGFFVFRALSCAAHAAKLRADHDRGPSGDES